jgi:hypothetical protein
MARKLGIRLVIVNRFRFGGMRFAFPPYAAGGTPASQPIVLQRLYRHLIIQLKKQVGFPFRLHRAPEPPNWTSSVATAYVNI